MRKLIINCQLEYDIPEDCKTEEAIISFAENIELPREYVVDSYELRGVWNSKTNQYETYL